MVRMRKQDFLSGFPDGAQRIGRSNDLSQDQSSPAAWSPVSTRKISSPSCEERQKAGLSAKKIGDALIPGLSSGRKVQGRPLVADEAALAGIARSLIS
jgi:hypothetical protein